MGYEAVVFPYRLATPPTNQGRGSGMRTIFRAIVTGIATGWLIGSTVCAEPLGIGLAIIALAILAHNEGGEA